MAGRASPTRILCPTYWYPKHSRDTRATYVHDINRHLVRRGHSVRVVTPAVPGAAAREVFDGVEVVRFPVSLPEDLAYGKVAQSRITALERVRRPLAIGRYLLAQRAALLREARRFDPHVLHAHWAIPTGPAALAAGRRLGLPVVVTMHGGDVYVNTKEGYTFPTRSYVRPVLRRTLRGVAALTAISEDCRQHALRAGAPDERMSIVPNGADVRRFCQRESDAVAALRARFGPNMIFACRQLFPRKGIRFLIEAAAGLKDEFPDLTVVLAGDGFERRALERLARELGIGDRVTFLGWVPNDELQPYNRAAAVAVVPSLEEGFGIPAAEAMACGTPAVVSDAGGLPEVVEHGVTGLVVPKGNVSALLAALATLLRDPVRRRRMGLAGRERALALFDWDHTAARMERLYDEVIGRDSDDREVVGQEAAVQDVVAREGTDDEPINDGAQETVGEQTIDDEGVPFLLGQP